MAQRNIHFPESTHLCVIQTQENHREIVIYDYFDINTPVF